MHLKLTKRFKPVEIVFALETRKDWVGVIVNGPLHSVAAVRRARAGYWSSPRLFPPPLSGRAHQRRSQEESDWRRGHRVPGDPLLTRPFLISVLSSLDLISSHLIPSHVRHLYNKASANSLSQRLSQCLIRNIFIFVSSIATGVYKVKYMIPESNCTVSLMTANKYKTQPSKNDLFYFCFILLLLFLFPARVLQRTPYIVKKLKSRFAALIMFILTIFLVYLLAFKQCACFIQKSICHIDLPDPIIPGILKRFIFISNTIFITYS